MFVKLGLKMNKENVDDINIYFTDLDLVICPVSWIEEKIGCSGCSHSKPHLASPGCKNKGNCWICEVWSNNNEE